MTIQNIDFSQVEQIGNRFISQLNALRELSPILWSETEQSWIITGHAEVAEAFAGNLPLSTAQHKLLNFVLPDAEERERMIPNMLKYFPHFLINIDPPDHTRVRSLMMKAFSRPVVEAYRPLARKVIHDVLDGVAAQSEVEFVEQVGRPITARNIMRLMGLLDEAFYLPKLNEWAYLANAAGSGRPNRELLARADAAFAEMAEAFRPEIESRRRKPTGDFISMLVHAGTEETRFSDEELIGELILVLLAGHDTTLNTMSLSINALASDAPARDYMRTDIIVVCLLVYSLLGLGTDLLVRTLEQKALAWRPALLNA